MSAGSNIKERFLDFRRRLYEAHDLSAVDDHVHPQFRSHSEMLGSFLAAARGGPDGPSDSRSGYRRFVQSLLTGIPDLRALRQEVVVEGDRLFAMTQWTGTHAGAFNGVPATGKTLRFATADLLRIEDGLLVEHRDVVDALEAWITLGLLHRLSAKAADPS
jgi:predicted ester cyclase